MSSDHLERSSPSPTPRTNAGREFRAVLLRTLVEDNWEWVEQAILAIEAEAAALAASATGPPPIARYMVGGQGVANGGNEPVAATGPLDGAGVVRILHSVGNTLAGWVRHMDGYGDDALAAAIDFVIRHPDPQERIAAARLASQSDSYAIENDPAND